MNEHAGVWELPERWEWDTLGDVCEINPRKPSLERDEDAPTSFVPMAALDEERGAITDMRVKPYNEVNRGYTYFEENDVLFAKITPCMENGKSAIARGLIDGIGFGSTEFHRIRPGGQLIPEWVHLFVRQQSFRDEAASRFRGSVGQQRVPKEFLLSHLIPVPPTVETQRRIVARIEELFARIEEARRLRSVAHEEAERLVDAAMGQVFRGLDDPLAEAWEWHRLGEVCEINPRKPGVERDGNTPTSFVPMAAVDDERGEITNMEVEPYDEVKRGYTYFEEDDVLFAKITPSMENGKSAVARGLIDGIGFGSTEFHRLRPGEKVIPEWVHLFIRQRSFRDEAASHFRGSVGQQRVPKEFLEAHLIPVPPIDEQRGIAQHLFGLQARVQSLKGAQERAEAEIDGLEQSILARAFRGEL